MFFVRLLDGAQCCPSTTGGGGRGAGEQLTGRDGACVTTDDPLYPPPLAPWTPEQPSAEQLGLKIEEQQHGARLVVEIWERGPGLDKKRLLVTSSKIKNKKIISQQEAGFQPDSGWSSTHDPSCLLGGCLWS